MMRLYPEQERAVARAAASDDTPLTILLVCDHAHVSGGLSRVAIASALELRARGHDVIFFAATGPICQTLSAVGIEVVCLDQPDMLGDPIRARAALRAFWNWKAAAALRRRLRNLDPARSIVHVHGWTKALSPSVLRAAARTGIATVQTLHDYALFCPNGALYDFGLQCNCPLRPLSLACVRQNCDARQYGHKLWRVARHMALDWFAQNLADADLIFLSRRQHEIIERYLPAGTRTHFVPNPVDVEDCGPAPVRANHTFIFIGRLSAEKGAALFARAASAEGVSAVFVGDGPARAEIAAMTDAPILGWLGKAEVERQLRNARALVFPSLWYETFGLSVFEAMAHGVPVIVSDNTPAAGMISPGKTGLLFHSGDAISLQLSIRRLRNDDLAERIGAAAYRSYWSSPFTPARHANALEKVYRQILDRRDAAPTARRA
jgi:glycosyltransferase involved in cell wall biosynthesis